MMARCYPSTKRNTVGLRHLLCLVLLCAGWLIENHCLAQDQPSNAWSGRSNPSNPNGGQGLLSRIRTANSKSKESDPKDAPADLADESKDRRWSGSMRVPLQSFNLPWANRNSDSKQSIQTPIDLPSAIKPNALGQANRSAQSRSTQANNPPSRNPYPQNSPGPNIADRLPQDLPAEANPIGSGVARRPNNTPSADALPTTSRRSSTDPISTQMQSQSPPTDAVATPATEPNSVATPDSDTTARKELRVYEAGPKSDSIDSKNTSRRKATAAATSSSKFAPLTPPVRSTNDGSKEIDDPNSIDMPPLSFPKSQRGGTSLESVGQPQANLQPQTQPQTQLPSRPGSSEINPLAQDTSAPFASVPRTPAMNTSAKNTAKNSLKSADSSRAPLDVRIPQLRLRVDGPESIQVGEKATYTIHATNEGDGELSGLIIRASTPKGVLIDGIKTMVGAYEMDETPEDIGVLWELESLGANDSKSLELQIEVLEAEQFALNLEWTLAPSPTQMNVQVKQPKLELALSGPENVEVGTAQKFRMKIKNAGTADLNDVSISLQTETTSQYESQVGSIQAGAEKVIDVELTFDQSGLFPIVATAKDSSGRLQQRQRIDVQVQKLQLNAKWTGPEEFIQGTQADYELVIENVGGIAARNLACSIDLPEGIEALELPKDIFRNGNQLRWTIDSLEPGTQFTFPIRCDMIRTGNQTIAFLARSERNLNFQANITTLVDAIADLELSVKEPQAPASVGSPVVYEIELANHGSKAAENIRVIAQFSEGIEPLKAEGQTANIVPGQVLFDEIKQVGPKQSIKLRVVCQASKNGVHRFRVAVQSPTSQEDLLEEGSTRFVGSGSRIPKP